MTKINPLVSIIVITYNSSKYVLETLESAKAQTYQNIELIITDDGSTDETVKICKDWLQVNKERFVNTKLVTVAINTGISSNCNRGLNVSKGEWLKFIAGDDILAPKMTKNFLNFCSLNSLAKCIFSKYQSFRETFHENNLLKILPVNDDHYFLSSSITAKEQYEFVINGTILWQASTFFVAREVIDKVGGFDEKYFAEDVIWTYILEKNYKLFYLPEVTVFKRSYLESTGNPFKYNSKLVINKYQAGLVLFKYNYIFYRVDLWKKLNILYVYVFYKIVLITGNKGFFCWILYRYFVLLPPDTIFNLLLKKYLNEKN